MSKRSNEKRITRATKVIRFLREQARVSLRDAEKLTNLSMSVISQIEHGRISVCAHHLEQLLPAYRCTRETYEMFLNGRAELPENLKFECIELIKQMSGEQVRTAYPVLASLSKR